VSPLVVSAVSPAGAGAVTVGAVVVTLVAAGAATLTVGAVDKVTVLDAATGSAAAAGSVELVRAAMTFGAIAFAIVCASASSELMVPGS
jgi:hypothetical protein